MVTLDELKKMSQKELDQEFQKSKLDLLKLRLGVSTRQQKETSKLKDLRKYIARIRTLKRMLEVEQIKENPKSTVIQ